MQIRIRRSDCCGSGLCVEIAPAVFALDPKSKCMVLDPEADSPEKVLEAAEACPCQAIEVLNDDGDPIFP
ncbi:MAG: ferredoxin [Candidatus Eisenbacteria bacterium]|nr:ferredoxin [Candidatus Eisenbacteria bacterium]